MDGTTKRGGRAGTERARRAMRVAIVGAGPAGLAMAIRLRAAGHDAITIFEKSDGVGGTWRDNTYPGAGCDIPALLYCFSFARKTNWSRAFVEPPEILAYFESLVDRFDLARHLCLRTEIRAATWDESRALWTLETTSGERHGAEFLVSALGQLSRPHVPTIDGAFDGASFHSRDGGTTSISAASVSRSSARARARCRSSRASRPTRRSSCSSSVALRRDLARSVWGTGCTSWYKDASGKITNNWSDNAYAYARHVRAISLDDFRFDRCVARPDARSSSDAGAATDAR